MITVRNIIIFLDVDELYACRELNMIWTRKLNEMDAWMIQSNHTVECREIKI